MVVFRFEKKRLHEFLQEIERSHLLIAPVKTDLVRFEKVADVKTINLDEQVHVPAKDIFFRKHEVIFTFDGKDVRPSRPSAPSTVIFGLRRCDLNAIHRQDIVFIHDSCDPHYTNARKNSYLIGYHCDAAPAAHCFCGSMELEDFHDLMFFDKKNHFLVEIGSEKGMLLVKNHTKFFKKTGITIHDEEKKIPHTDKLKKKDISSLYNHPDWKEMVDACFSCAACTTLCPTCYCFEIHDEPLGKDAASCSRCREWSSCQLTSFTHVAGDYIFRKGRDERFKHRIYHQLQYFKEKYAKNLCVGCGRCITECPTRIDWVKGLNRMKHG